MAMGFEEIGYRFAYMEWAKTVMEAGLPGVVDIGSSGIAPLTLRELGVRLSHLELTGPHYYGEPVLRRRIARLAETDESRVLPTLGASHAHFLICASLVRPGDEVIVESPGYEALSSVPRALGARIVPLARRFEDGFQFDPRELRRLLTRRTRLILVTNLHNPSGVALSPGCLEALAECAAEPEGPRSRSADRLARGTWVVVNEVYRDFVVRNPPIPGHALGPRGVSLGSLTKVYGLGETRVGWAIGDAALLRRGSRVNDFGVVNSPYIAERIGALALARRARLLRRTRAILHRNRPILDRFLRGTPELALVPPAAGTLSFPRLRGISNTRAFAARVLREKGVCVVPGEFFGAPGHIRIGIGGRGPGRLERSLHRLRAAILEKAGDRRSRRQPASRRR